MGCCGGIGMASQRQLRMGFGLIGVLSSIFLLNLFHFQPSGYGRSSKRIIFPGSGSDLETAGIDRRGPEALPQAREEPAVAPPIAATGEPGGPGTLRMAVARELAARNYMASQEGSVGDLLLNASIIAFEWDNQLPLTGEPSEKLLQQIILGARAGGTAETPMTATPSATAEQVIRTVQRSLAALGYPALKADGRLGTATSQAIRSFEKRQGLPQTGRISGTLVTHLVELASKGQLADRG